MLGQADADIDFVLEHLDGIRCRLHDVRVRRKAIVEMIHGFAGRVEKLMKSVKDHENQSK